MKDEKMPDKRRGQDIGNTLGSRHRSHSVLWWVIVSGCGFVVEEGFPAYSGVAEALGP